MEHAAASAVADVREEVAQNPVVPLVILVALRADESASVRVLAWSHPRTDLGEIREYLKHGGMDPATLIGIIRHPDVTIDMLDSWAAVIAPTMATERLPDVGREPIGVWGQWDDFVARGPMEDVGRRFSAIGQQGVERALLCKLENGPRSLRGAMAAERLRRELGTLQAIARNMNRM